MYNMEEKKTLFFKKVKNAIINFDEYQNFSKEKLGTAIKYFLKLMIIFYLVILVIVRALLLRMIRWLK